MGDTVENEFGELAPEQCFALKTDNLGYEEWSSVSNVYGSYASTIALHEVMGIAVYVESTIDDGYIATYKGAHGTSDSYEYIISKFSNDGIENWRKYRIHGQKLLKVFDVIVRGTKVKQMIEPRN